MILVTALQRRLRRKAVAKLCEWPSSRCVSDSSRYIRSRAQYAAKWCVVVTVEPPKGTEGITRHDEASLSQHMAAETGGWRRPSKRSVTWTEGSESVHNNSPRALLRCTSEGCPAHMDGRAKSIQQQKLQGTPQVYKRGVPSAHGRKGANQFTTIATGHPSGVQARGAQRTWTEGRKRFNNKSCRAPLRCTSEGCPAHIPCYHVIRRL